ncbi:MAG TPA: NAD-dependent epimerase/dehydratase family protein [Bryobacteraceae bacterium]|nr:NAD-dependent epimerase/dehydratase family protein [Bryobacteraceae bacterium]HZU43574.1 NAD-dependent epimerase/dehydratase family protein [Terriglobales bacterium]
MRAFVTGCAGFIGSNLVDGLLASGHSVTGFDNFSTGRPEFLAQAQQCSSFRLERGDLLDLGSLTRAMKGSDIVFHMAANADVRWGLAHPRRDLEQNTIATWNVLEGMRSNEISRIAFASTGAVYGEAKVFPTPEDCAFPVQTSLYGSSKLAAEGLIQAYSEGFGMQSFIFRFVSILGERYTHGHVFDFYRQLKDHPQRLDVLGNGLQRKSYLYVRDCISAILIAVERAKDRINIFNLGTDEYCQVKDSVRWICGQLGLQPEICYSGGERGWIGDNPFILLDCTRMRALGWAPQLTIEESICRTVTFLQNNEWALSARA